MVKDANLKEKNSKNSYRLFDWHGFECGLDGKLSNMGNLLSQSAVQPLPTLTWRCDRVQYGISMCNYDVLVDGTYMGVNPKIGGVSPKMDGENNGKPY